MKLTEKQKRFADYYIETGNATESYKRAGYGEKGARANSARLIANDNIRAYIDKRIAEKDEKRIAKQDEILAYLTSVMRGEHQEEVLRGVGEGAQTIDDIDVSAKERIKAAELLGKRYAMWTDKQEVSGEATVKFEYNFGDEDGESD
ncbi:terminase small subunit [Pseudobacillus sp. FSL P4-0506]|uniref:terminase small subunit n=1 Tax=Pseudobacillus sp. FSL P4-0506 TaxID=2921576 RepID=UPI0030FC7D8D